MVQAAQATTVVTEQTLTLLQNVNSFISAPGVEAAAGAALSILALVQTVKSNKKEFIAVGEKACTIMVAVVRKVSSAERNHQANLSTLGKECGDLRSSLQTVEKIVHKHVQGRKRFALLKRVMYSKLDQEVIKDCKERLQSALDLFNVQSHIEVRQGVEEANNKLDQLVERGEGGGGGPHITQYAGGNTYSHTEDNSVRVSGSGNNVNVSTASPSPVYYHHPGHYY